MTSPFRYFKTSPEVIRSAVSMYVRYPLSLRNVEDLLFERGIDVTYETVRQWWNRFGPMFAGEIRRRRAASHRSYTQWRWHLDEVFVRINGETRYLWRAVDHEGEVLEVFVTRRRDREGAKVFLKRAMKRYGRPRRIVTDRLSSYGAALREIGNAHRQDFRNRHRWYQTAIGPSLPMLGTKLESRIQFPMIFGNLRFESAKGHDAVSKNESGLSG